MKKMVLGISILMVMIIFTFYLYHLQSIDTKYAINYAKVFGSYDINQVDLYLSSSTAITYQGTTKTYEELRDNVINAFHDKNFSMAEDSSYGHAENSFIDKVQIVGIQSYVDCTNDHEEVYIKMLLERKGINTFSIKALSSDDEFFGYLFYGFAEADLK